MSVVKASELSELLKDYDVEISPKNIGRFTQNYGIKKDRLSILSGTRRRRYRSGNHTLFHPTKQQRF